MKKAIILSALGAMLMASCADDFDRSFEVGRPDMEAEYGYLKDYAPLKEYVDRSAYPNFKLGVGTTVSDYLKGELVYALTNSNFDETVAGNAMKMASCVKDDGSMDFSAVTDYVKTATDAGLSVYGHTLAWHSQQPVKWLNSLLKDKELDIDPDQKIEKEVYRMDFSSASSYSMWGSDAAIERISVGDGALNVTSTSTTANFWDVQFMVADGISLVEGAEYVLRIELKGSPANSSLHYVVGPWGNDVKAGTIEFKEDWASQDIRFTAAGDMSGVHCILQSGDYVGSYSIKSVTLYSLETPAVEVEHEVNVKTYTDGPFPFYAMGCEPPVINGCIHFVPDGNWSQFFVFPGGENHLDEGNYVVYLDLTSDRAASGVQLTIQNGWGSSAQNLTVAVPVEAGQKNYRLSFPGVTGGDYDIILKPQTADAVLDLRSVTVSKLESLNAIPLTDEEKHDTLVYAMDKWINGMMTACDGQVKAWDVVNEAISGGNPDGEGVYALQHQSDNPNDFFWQNYLGDLDYVRQAVRLARQYGPEDVKLFINDYNLESDWDDNGKLRSLIKWIQRWESDGITKIDGIGSQMHISCYMNPVTQQSKKDHIVKMLQLMASTGKLVRISELDMGLVDADGNEVITANVTEEQHHAMADLYKFIVEKYLEIIPVSQQWGICQWAPTDSPANSGWRANSPLGLWDLNYHRKHTYAGFADGLSGK